MTEARVEEIDGVGSAVVVDIKMSSRDELASLVQDMADCIVGCISCQYRPIETTLELREGQLPLLTIVKSELLEVSRPGSWEVVRDITLENSLHAEHARLGPITGKVIGWDRIWTGAGRTGTITLGACLGTGATGVGDVADADIVVDPDTTAVPVNAYALSVPSYSVVDVAVSYDADAQLALAADEIAQDAIPRTSWPERSPKCSSSCAL